jgi:1-acyl-sn-glycerol-3-phosphate acyltransferase
MLDACSGFQAATMNDTSETYPPVPPASPVRRTRSEAGSAKRSKFQYWGYDLFRVLARLVGVWGYGLRAAGRENWPETGGGLVCANHQSHFDPPLVGLTCSRRMNYLARDTLFRVPGLKQLIHFLDAIPIDREGGGLAGLKETLRRLKAGELVLIFPEGTRTHDGEVAPLKPGFIAVARRSRVPLIPVGIDGAYQAWPRTACFRARAGSASSLVSRSRPHWSRN